MEWFKGKKTVITGGSSGIGKAAAILLAQAGGHVCICARDRARMDEALKEMTGPRFLDRSENYRGDPRCRRPVCVKAAVSEIVNQLGGIDSHHQRRHYPSRLHSRPARYRLGLNDQSITWER